MKIFIHTLIIFLSSSLFANAQQRINGRVMSAKGEPISATLKLKSNGLTTIANGNGLFQISSVHQHDTLLISAIGYLTDTLSVQLPSVHPLEIILQTKNIELNLVTISTGYQTLSKERATGSFTQLNTKSLNNNLSTDILSRLKGNANGLSFDERIPTEAHINVRGLSTINGSTAPLIVLNNFPFDGDLNDINPNDVESITILKDAAAASIWGVRAANGVVVITTKKGGFNKKQQVSFNSNISFGNKPDVYKIPIMSSADYIGVEKYLFGQGFYSTTETDPAHAALSPAVELLIAQRDGIISESQLNSQLDALSKIDVRNDFNKYLYKNSVNQQYSLNINGGSDRMSYYYSVGYDHNIDNLNGQYGRFTMRADNVFSIGSLRLNPVVAYTRSSTTAGTPGYNSIYPGDGKGLYPYTQLADASGNALAITKNYRTSYVDSATSKGLQNWQYAPLSDFKQRNTVTTVNDLTAGLNLDYAITKKLTAQAQYQYECMANDLSDLYSTDSYYARNLINNFTQDDGSGNLNYIVPKGGILNTSNNGLLSQSGRIQLKYDNNWNKNNLSALAGAELKDIHQTGNYYTTYDYSKSGLTSVPVDYTDQYPQYSDNGNYRGVPYNTNFTDLTNRYKSYYANAAYTYDERYILSASARKDESNIFGVKANQRGIPLWSSGAAWNVYKEDFYKAGWVNYLKLRVTYGYNGNLPQNITAVATLLQVPGNYNNQPYALVSTYPNADLRWEKVGVFNAGIDFGTRNNTLSGSLDYYHKSGSDLIGTQPIDPTVGIPSGLITRNVADMVSNGIDLQLNAKIIDKTFKWVTGVNFNYNADKVTAYNSTLANGSQYINGGLGVAPVVGKPVNSVFSFKWSGLDPATGDPIGLLDGDPSKDYTAIVNNTQLSDLKYNGPGLPPYFGNLYNTLSYKGISLYVNITYRFGYFFQSPSISYYYLYNNGIGNSDFSKRWQKAGDEQYTIVPSMPTIANNSYERDFFYTNSSALVEKADNIRLQDLNLSYEPKVSKWRFLPIKTLQLYVYGRNLGILWRANKSGIDPDYASGYLPPSYTLSFGCKATF